MDRLVTTSVKDVQSSARSACEQCGKTRRLKYVEGRAICRQCAKVLKESRRDIS